MNQDSIKSLSYRKATTEDLAALQQTMIEAYKGYQNILLPEYWEKMKGNLANEETSIHLLELGTGFVCEHKGFVIGVVFVVPSGNPTALFSAEWSYIRMLGVLPKYRGLGIASALMSQCIDHAIEAGEQVLALHTAGYQSAWHIYERLGFRKVKDLELILGQYYWLYTLDLQQHIMTRCNTNNLEFGLHGSVA